LGSSDERVFTQQLASKSWLLATISRFLSI
jgi:hypothetical protein